jgi:hypothetical protein
MSGYGKINISRRGEAIVGKSEHFMQPPAFDSIHDKVAAENSNTNSESSCPIAECKYPLSSFYYGGKWMGMNERGGRGAVH